ncbi:MAG: hypothetical protein ABIQ31_00145 [Ferruginibacter sp.]
MNWEVIDNERSSLKEYRLIENNDCKLVIKYNPRHQSARITSGNHHRLFFFESAGSLSGKTIFRNEYGMEIGNLVHDKFHSEEGSLVIDAKKYQYQLHKDTASELVIYENGLQKPVASCSIPTNKSIIQNIFSEGTQAIDNNCYLLGLCWYLVLPLVKENILKLASAGV